MLSKLLEVLVTAGIVTGIAIGFAHHYQGEHLRQVADLLWVIVNVLLLMLTKQLERWREERTWRLEDAKSERTELQAAMERNTGALEAFARLDQELRKKQP
jgi:hypothetical protein